MAIRTLSFIAAIAALSTIVIPASADPDTAVNRLMGLPKADIAKLVGLWQVREMEPLKMIYEFQSATMAMHGSNAQGGSSFELTLDADYRTAGDNAIWVIGTHPRPTPEGTDADSPSIMGIEFTKADEVTLTVSAGESFTLVKVP